MIPINHSPITSYQLPVTNRGFTLIEMLVATSLLVLVLIAISSTYRAGMNAWQSGEEGIDSLYGARLAQEMITADLRATFSPPPDLSNPQPPEITFIGKPTEVEFITSSNNPDLLSEKRESDLIKVRYLLKEGELKRDSGNSEDLTLSTGIREISFDYHNGRTWQDFWDSDEFLPKGVRIEIELDNGRRLSTMVWLPTSAI